MGLIGDVARTAVAAGTWTAVSNRVSKRQAGRWAAEDQSRQSAYMPPPPGRYQRPMYQPHIYQQQPVYAYVQATPPPAADAMTARLTQLQQLGNMRAQGLLTESEFEALKSRILGTGAGAGEDAQSDRP